MSYQLIAVSQKARVGIVALNRPKQLNALSSALMAELGQALIAFDTDDTWARLCSQQQGLRRGLRVRREHGPAAARQISDAAKGAIAQRIPPRRDPG
jgi:hypothetical protein